MRFTLILFSGMFKRKNSLPKIFVLLAVAGFLFFSIGGEFFHEQIHHHAAQDSRDECSIFLLAAQSAVALTAIVLAFIPDILNRISKTSLVCISPARCYLPNLRAPPSL